MQKKNNTRRLCIKACKKKKICKRSTKDVTLTVAGVYVSVVWQLMESQFVRKRGRKGCGLKRGNKSKLCKVNWSAECLPTNDFKDVVS